MEQKAKFIIIGLIGVIIVCLILFAQTLTSKQQLLREKDDLQSENTALNSKVEQLNISLRSKQKDLDSVRGEIDKTKQDYQDLQGKYDLLKATRDNLLEKFKYSSVVQVAPSEIASATPDAYWADILKAKKELEMQLASVREELKSTQINTEQLQREKSSLEMDVKGLQRDKEDLQRQLDYNKKLMDSIAQELVRERNDKIKIEESSKAIKNENVILSRQLKTLNARKGELEDKLRGHQDEKAKLEDKVSVIEGRLSDNILQIDKLKQELETISPTPTTEVEPPEKKDSVELPPIVVRPAADTTKPQVQASGLTARVLTIDRENNFVVIDSGEEAGIKVGDTFSIYRGSEKIASIEVIKTSKTVAACDIKKESLPIKIGDIVK